jgi:hypothetical protein
VFQTHLVMSSTHHALALGEYVYSLRRGIITDKEGKLSFDSRRVNRGIRRVDNNCLDLRTTNKSRLA